MKVSEIISEQHVNEVIMIPPAVAAAWGALSSSLLAQKIWQALMLVFNAWGVYSSIEYVMEYVKELTNGTFDIDSMTAEHWGWLAIMVSIGYFSAKGTKDGAKYFWDKLPPEWRNKLGDFAKEKLEKKIKDEIAKKNPSGPTKTTSDPAKNPNWTEKFPKR